MIIYTLTGGELYRFPVSFAPRTFPKVVEGHMNNTVSVRAAVFLDFQSSPFMKIHGFEIEVTVFPISCCIFLLDNKVISEHHVIPEQLIFSERS